MPPSRLRPIVKKSRKDDIVKSFRKQNKNLLQKLRASERKLADREKCDKIKALLNTMSGFISKSLSTSSAHANTSAFKLANASICSVDAILAQENIPLLLPLTAEELHDFCEQVKHKLDNKKSDTKGIHPQVVDIFKACVCPAANFVILHETIIRDMEKRPDISLVMRTNVKKNIESVVVPTEIKKLKDLKNAIVQALGYLASKMLNVLDTVGFEQKIFGYCLGTDGLQLSVGYFAIENYEVKVLMTKYENADCPLLPSKFRPGEKETYPREEPLGVRIIRSLQACTPQQLGHGATDNVCLEGKNGMTYQINSVIGRGHFCTAFHATAISREVFCPIVIKREKCGPVQQASTCKNRLAHLNREVNILREFSESNLNELPRLFDDQWSCSQRRMYIPMLPVGIPLELHAGTLSQEGRRQQAIVLHMAVCQELQAAHDLNWCHSDLRPQNVVYDQVGSTYCVIDWGLAVREGDKMHHYRGGLAFFDDEIVCAYEVKAGHEPEAFIYYRDYDFSSAKYVACAFVLGKKNLDVDWSSLLAGQEMVDARVACMEDEAMEELLFS